MSDKQKKKLTKKEQKALNHAKLMANKKGSAASGNVIQVNFQAGQDKDKKAA